MPKEGFWGSILGKILGMITEGSLRAAGASEGQMEHSATLSAEVPSFHSEPAPPEGVLESRDLAHCLPELQARYTALARDFQLETGRELFLTSTWRSVERQQELFQQGRRGLPGERKVTWVDGINRKSRHNFYPSRAVDVCVDGDPGPGKVAVWDEEAYMPLMDLALRHGLRWGGDWNRNGIPVPDDPAEKSIDYPHLEIPPEDL